MLSVRNWLITLTLLLVLGILCCGRSHPYSYASGRARGVVYVVGPVMVSYARYDQTCGLTFNWSTSSHRMPWAIIVDSWQHEIYFQYPVGRYGVELQTLVTRPW